MTSHAAESIAWSNQDPTVKVRIPMHGPSNRQTGYGNHFVELVLGLLRQGADISVMPYFCEPPLPPEFLATMIEPWDFEAPLAIHMANPTRLSRISPHTIGITTWETTKLPPDEVQKPLSSVDEFIVPCRDNIAMIKDYRPDAEVHYVPEGVDADFYAFQDRDWSAKPLKIGMFGALTHRKGIDIGIEAFLELFEGNPDVELHIGTSVSSLEGAIRFLPDAYPNIKVQRFGWHTREQVRDWYYDKHALLAPFRGEGFYLPGPEFMATGGCVIAPDKMGAEAWMQPTMGWVIPSHYGPVLHWGPEWHGAQATERYGEWLHYEPEDVVKTLADFVNAPPEEKRRRAAQAHGNIPFLCSWDFAAQRTIDIFLDAYRSHN
jgi:glycosyltransferase involved in cell wall biosynthesis